MIAAPARIAHARSALIRGDLPLCLRLAQEVLARAPEAPPSASRAPATPARPPAGAEADAEAHFLIAMALAEGGRIGPALAALDQAVALAPDHAEYRAQSARLLILARREEEARAAADTARALSARRGDDQALVLDTIGCVYARLGDHDRALPLFRQAVARTGDSVGYRFNLASSLGFFGLTKEAEREYEAILALDPGHGRAHLGLSGLRRQTPSANHLPRLKAALAAADDATEGLRIHYALAKEYEDLGDHEAAFGHLHTANTAHRKRRRFDPAADQRTVEAIMRHFADPDYFSGASALTDRPVFVVGMPRTGTTLVDSILSAHPALRSAGEMQAMPLALKRAARTSSRLVLDRDTVAAAAVLSPTAIGRDYLARARQHSGGENARFTDKLPLNFLYIGYIARALPQARIVCLRRNPMDTVWSNYKNLFATTSSFYGWSYDLMDTAAFYALFDRLMAFWRDLFPGRILELGYEALVADPQEETRRLLDHCDLPWDETCLRFHENTAAVATPSAQQVRRPINAGSVEKWRAYARQLEPVRAWFAQQGLLPRTPPEPMTARG